jgi:hypothetical protein
MESKIDKIDITNNSEKDEIEIIQKTQEEVKEQKPQPEPQT